MDTISEYWQLLILVGIGAVLLIAFVFLYVVPSFALSRKLRVFARNLEPLRDQGDPLEIKHSAKHLRHLWGQYRKTLHAEKSADENGLEIVSRYHATLPASAVFHSGSVIDGQLSVEFFKHLPGLLTGLGIIGTFSGLITGLRHANSGGGFDTQALIASVGEAFMFSAAAIIAAMVVTFLEKWRYARLLHLTDQLCRDIDRLYSAGLGEEYLRRLVVASEQALTNSQQLKDSLVGELGAILERLSQKQIEATSRHNIELRNSLQEPIEAVAHGFREFSRLQGDAIGAGFQDQMSAFAAKLDELLGGQIGQARELQAETVRALQSAVSTFQGMAQSVSTAGEAATNAMADQLQKAIDSMAVRQADMSEAMRTFLNEMRGNAEQSQAHTQSHLVEMLQGLGTHMSSMIGGLREQGEASGETARAHQQSLSDEARRTIDSLAGEVRNQSQAVEKAALAMRGTIADLDAAAARNVQAVGSSAEKMTAAAGEFTRTGTGLSQMFEKAGTVTGHMTQAAEALHTASTTMGQIAADHRDARKDFETIVRTLRETVASASRDASMTAEIVGRIDQAAGKLREAQVSADAYLTKLNEVLATAHEQFSLHMQETVKKATQTFFYELTQSTQLISNMVAELDDVLGQASTRQQ